MSKVVAYSYVRFSSAKQAEGDSLRRQTELAQAYCDRYGWHLDTALSIRDLGVSAFKGANSTFGNFRLFLDAVKSGRVTRGSVLVVESFDRISRQGIDEGYDLVKSILKAGVKIVTLSPEREFDVESTKSLSKGALEIQLILERAAEESERKSERVGAARKRERVRAAQGEIITRRVPAWVRVSDDNRLTLDAKKAATVRRMFRMLIDGRTLTDVAKVFNSERVPLLGRTEVAGRAVVWSAARIHRIATSRSVLGELQPHTEIGDKGRRAAGPPIADYYPRVVDDATFAAAQSALRARAYVGRGRRGKNVNLFAGLLRDARTGGTLTALFRKGRESSLFPANAVHGRGARHISFPLSLFERAVIEQLLEVQVHDVCPDAPAADNVARLSERAAELETLKTRWRAKMDVPELVEVVSAKLVELEREHRAALEQLEAAQRETGAELPEALGGLRSIAATLATDNSDENRVRCRAAIRRAVESVWCVFRPGKGVRVAVVQVWFRGGRQRTYFIVARPAMRNARATRRESYSGRSFADVGSEIDLRVRADAERVAKLVDRIDIDAARLTLPPAEVVMHTDRKRKPR